MVIDKLRINLQAETFGTIESDISSQLKVFMNEFSIDLPEDYIEFLHKFRSSIVFNVEVRITPSEACSFVDSTGLIGVEILYGATGDEDGLRNRNLVYRQQLNEGIIAIGEGAGGNLYCLEVRSGRILFWDHESQNDAEAYTEVGANFTNFVEKLVSIDEQKSCEKMSSRIKAKSLPDFDLREK